MYHNLLFSESIILGDAVLPFFLPFGFCHKKILLQARYITGRDKNINKNIDKFIDKAYNIIRRLMMKERV
jgi:hypothetical protein